MNGALRNIDEALGTDEAKALIALCRKGRLYGIEKWIAAGKSLDISSATRRGKQRSLLEIAVETGFHSLVELVAKHETSQSAKAAALGDAASSRRLDLVELLLANGADVKSVPLAEVLLSWEPKLIHFFLDHGADPVAGSPFAERKSPCACLSDLSHRSVLPLVPGAPGLSRAMGDRLTKDGALWGNGADLS
jgi:hypothetical protein